MGTRMASLWDLGRLFSGEVPFRLYLVVRLTAGS